MRSLKKIISFTLLLGTTYGYCFEFKTDKGSKNPIEIEADDGISCNQETKTCHAKGHVMIAQGNTILKADAVTVHLDDLSEAHKSLKTIKATGNVSIETTVDPKRLTADEGVYHIQEGTMSFSGRPVAIYLGENWIKAHHLYYDEKAGLVTAKGDAKAFKDGSVLTATVLKAHLVRNSRNQLVVQEIKAENNSSNARVKILLSN